MLCLLESILFDSQLRRIFSIRTNSRLVSTSPLRPLTRPHVPLTRQPETIQVRDPLLLRPLPQVKALLPGIDAVRVHADVTRVALRPRIPGTPNLTLFHLPLPISAYQGDLLPQHLSLARKREAPHPARLAEQKVQPVLVAGVVAQLGERVQGREQDEVLGRVGQADVQDTCLDARGAIAPVKVLQEPPVRAMFLSSHARGMRREDEVDYVLGGAAVT